MSRSSRRFTGWLLCTPSDADSAASAALATWTLMRSRRSSFFACCLFRLLASLATSAASSATVAAMRSGDVRTCPNGRTLSTGCTGHSARVTRSVLDRGRGDSPVGLRRNRNTLKDRDESGRGSKSDNSLPVETIDGVIHSNARHDSASESGNGTLSEARPE